MLNWQKLFERDYTVQYWETCPYILCAENKKFVIRPVEDIVIYKSQKTGICFGPTEELKVHQTEIMKFYSDPKHSSKFIKFFIETGKKYIETARKTGAQLRSSDLATIYKNYWKQWTLYTSVLYVTFELNDLFANNLCEFIEKRYSEIKPDVPLTSIFSHCLRPTKIAATVQAGIDALEVKKNYSGETLENFRKKYEWFPCLDLKFEPLSLSGAREIVETTQAIEKKHATLNVAKVLKLSAEEEEFVNVARTYFYVKDLRDEYRRRGVFNVIPLYKQLSRKLGISYNQTINLLSSEILAGLSGTPVNIKEANTRLNQSYFLWRQDNKVKCITGTAAEKRAAELKINEVKQSSAPLVLKGISASKGIVRGKVRLVKVAVHLHRVQKGEILVALTTNPNYLTAMNIASAIVTDEGGLTSHAAIVAREMKKPCVVGTKMATKFLNDGDLVEVNGTTGEVRKIE